MLNMEATERQLVGEFLEVIRGLPEVRADLEPRQEDAAGADRGYDAQVDLHVAGKSVTVLVEAKKLSFHAMCARRSGSLENTAAYGQRGRNRASRFGC